MPAKLFLASSLDQTLPKMVEVMKLQPKNLRVGFIHEAARPYGIPADQFWVKADYDKFLELGFEIVMINLHPNHNPEKTKETLNNIDILHICGGNTLYINVAIHRLDLHPIIRDKVNSGSLIYTGTSAGSMITAPTLFGMKDTMDDDSAVEFLKNIQKSEFESLNLTNFLVIPHIQSPEWQAALKETITRLPNYPHPLIFLRDNQAVWVEGEKFQIVSI